MQQKECVFIKNGFRETPIAALRKSLQFMVLVASYLLQDAVGKVGSRRCGSRVLVG